MELICPNTDCTGCAACMNICPKGAIEMQKGDLGCEYPIIDPSLCIDCHLCQKVCPVVHPVSIQQPLHAYAAVMKKGSNTANCASGGVATAISNYIIQQGGVVYGCAQANCLDIAHQRVDDLLSLEHLKGSKYVQSRINFTFRSIKADLKAGKSVLFIGAPCQVAGLKNYLQYPNEHLYTVDLVCHGVPSQSLLLEHLHGLGFDDSELKKLSVSFRRHTKAGVEYRFSLLSKDSSDVRFTHPYLDDAYLVSFMQGLSFRENCHHCRYAQANRVADLTLADFWGLCSTAKPFRRGASLVLVNTQKGQLLWSKLSDTMIIEERPIAEAINGNGQLKSAFKRPEQKDLFKKVWLAEGLSKANAVCSTAYIARYRKGQKSFLRRYVITNYPCLVNAYLWINKMINK